MFLFVIAGANESFGFVQGRSDGVDIGIYTPPPEKKISPSKLYVIK